MRLPLIISCSASSSCRRRITVSTTNSSNARPLISIPRWKQQKQKQQQQLLQLQCKRSHYRYSGPGSFNNDNDNDNYFLESHWKDRDFEQRGFTVGIGGPVGSGKTALVLKLCQLLEKSNNNKNNNNDMINNTLVNNVAVVTNDIFTQEDAEFLVRNGALPADRIRAVETGGCPHAAIREDISANLSALEDLTRHVQVQRNKKTNATTKTSSSSTIPLLFCESGGDNLAANFSRELADLTLYVIDVAGGDKVPRKGGPGITQSDLLIINKIDLAEAVGADLNVMQHDAAHMRGGGGRESGPTILAAVKQGIGVPEILDFILKKYQQAVAFASAK